MNETEDTLVVENVERDLRPLSAVNKAEIIKYARNRNIVERAIALAEKKWK